MKEATQEGAILDSQKELTAEKNSLFIAEIGERQGAEGTLFHFDSDRAFPKREQRRLDNRHHNRRVMQHDDCKEEAYGSGAIENWSASHQKP